MGDGCDVTARFCATVVSTISHIVQRSFYVAFNLVVKRCAVLNMRSLSFQNNIIQFCDFIYFLINIAYTRSQRGFLIITMPSQTDHVCGIMCRTRGLCRCYRLCRHMSNICAVHVSLYPRFHRPATSSLAIQAKPMTLSVNVR